MDLLAAVKLVRDEGRVVVLVATEAGILQTTARAGASTTTTTATSSSALLWTQEIRHVVDANETAVGQQTALIRAMRTSLALATPPPVGGTVAAEATSHHPGAAQTSGHRVAAAVDSRLCSCHCAG